MASFLNDLDFLEQLNNQKLKKYFVKILVLDINENPIRTIEGRVQTGGSINIDGSSAMRRSCSLTFIAEEGENDLTDVDNLLSINKRIQIFEGIENNVNNKYGDDEKICWFKLGTFVIIDPSISHNTKGVTISLTCKDKMCTLNGDCGGGLPTSITFHEYDQLDEEGNRQAVPQLVYDIIQTLVCNYGGESISKIFISDVEREIKQIVRYSGTKPLYYNPTNNYYTLDENEIINPEEWKVFSKNSDVGYIYTPFTYPGELISNIGDTVTSVLDTICSTLGNYEYFYDVDGNFIFREKKNYLNNSYNPTNKYRLDNYRRVDIDENNLAIINETNYYVDFSSNGKSIYTFSEGDELISSYTAAPSYSKIKNDFHIWGKSDNETQSAIHYHLVIKKKPEYGKRTWYVAFLKNEDGEYDGRIRLATPEETKIASGYVSSNTLYLTKDDENEVSEEKLITTDEDIQVLNEEEQMLVNAENVEIVPYKAADWRAEIYLQGLEKQQLQQRPDIYEQELLDLFDSIYNFKDKCFKSDIVKNPNELLYFFDYLEPTNKTIGISVDALRPRVYSYQQDKIKKLFTEDVPNLILVNAEDTTGEKEKTIERCKKEGQPYSNINAVIYSYLSIGTYGYSAQEVARDLLYQYTDFNETVTLQSIPIYYLEPNRRITLQDRSSGIKGDYVIKSISLPFNAVQTMNISATKALERI